MMFRTILVLGALALSSYAAASGFQLQEHNASGIGNAYAGSAAVADDASTIFSNPAGMTQLQDKEFSVGLSAVGTSFKFSNEGSTGPVGGTPTGGEGGDSGSWNYIPNGYLSWALNKNLYLGAGFSVPFGSATEYDSNWVGRFQAVKFEIKTANINPAMAYRVNDWVSVGFGVNWQKMDADYVRQAALPAVSSPINLPASIATIRLKADDDAWGWNAGVLFQVAPSTKVGVSYRSKVKYTLDGSISSASSDPRVNGPAMADVELPDTLTLSATHSLSSRWEILGDVAWTGWSSIKTVNIIDKRSGSTVQPLDLQFDDTWRIAVGANYLYDDVWMLKGGIAYDQTPVPDAEHRLTTLPDSDRVWFTAGAQWKPAKTSAVNFGFAYLYIKDTAINNDQRTAGRGLVNGRYNSSDVVLFGAQYSMNF